jgi:hypothetical protein
LHFLAPSPRLCRPSPLTVLASQMAPPVQSFSAADLPNAIQIDTNGRKRKVEGGGKIELSTCAMFSMLQYECAVARPLERSSPVICSPVERRYRR